ncbi:MAG: NACHT domain-containing protein [Leptolyngbyaceae cyanobacterium RM1_405_57]|nr:NACHT domain-containing protein [Leptolyngbyaceae cyanobacterium RM1_405_57]
MTQTPDPNQTPDEKLPLSEQIADILLRVIMTGGVGLGGLGAFWSLFKENDIPRAVVCLVIGAGFSYGASLLDPLHKGNKRRLAKMGEDVDRGFDRITENAIARVRGVEDQYFQCQAWDCRRYRSEGIAQHDRIFTPLLEDVFVPLQLDPGSLQPGFRSQDIERLQQLMHSDGQKIWDLLKQADKQPVFRQIVILAWGGYGKTTLLKHIAYTYGMNQQGKYEAPRLTPFLLMLRKYRDVIAQEQPPNLPELITQRHVPSLPESEQLTLPSDWAKNKLLRGEAVVMLDGFDEVAKSQRPAVARWINDQMRRYGRSIFILTSRPKAYKDQDVSDRLELATQLWVKDLNPQQRQDFVQKWYLCQERYAAGGEATPDVQKIANQAAKELLTQIEARQELTDLAKNPLLLNMIVTFHRRYPGAELPKRRVELYREICLLQLRDRPAARQLETLLTQCEAQIILQMLALAMMKKRWERIQRPVMLQWLDYCLKQQKEIIKSTEFLDQVVQISELLVEQEDEYEFAHLSFQEYLAATQLAQQKQEKLLYEYFNDDWWKQTILLYATQVNPTSLIREAMQRGATDLAYRCYQETTRRVNTALASELNALKQTVQISRYAKLKEYLKTGSGKRRTTKPIDS